MPNWWELEPSSTYQQTQPAYDREEAEREALRELNRKREEQRTFLERMMSAGGFAGAARGAFQGATLPLPPGVPRGQQIAAGALLGGLGETEGTRLQPNWAGVLEQQGGLPRGPALGPVDARGALGFGLDVALDPLGYVPAGKVSQGLRAIPAAFRAPQAADYVRRQGPRAFTTASDVLSEGLEKTAAGRGLEAIAGKIPGFGGMANRVSPSLMAQEPLEVAFRRGQAIMGDEIRAVADTIKANPGVRDMMARLDDAGRIDVPGVGKVAWNDLFQRPEYSTQLRLPAAWKKPIDDARNAWEDLMTWYTKEKVDKARGILTPEELTKYEIVPFKLRPDAKFYPRVALKDDVPVGLISNLRPGRRGINFQREFPTHERGIQAGVKYADPITSFEIRAKDVLTLANRLDMEVALHGQPGAAKALIDKVGMEAVDPFLGKIADAASIPRMVQTGFDLGGMFIQGVPHLARNPDVFVKAFGNMTAAFFRPEIHDQLIASNVGQRVYAAIPNLGVAAGGREAYEALGPGRLIARGLGGLGRPGRAVLGAAERFETAFDTAGDAMRIYAGEAWLPYLARHPEDAQKVGDFLNHMSGFVSRAGQGVGKTQQAVERILLFAPSYNASAFALMGDVLREGPVAAEATKTLANMLVVGLIGYQQAVRAVGQPAVLDPADARFLTLDVGGTRIGIGSVWTALARSLGQIEAKAENVARGNQPPPQPSDLLDPQNPFVRFWRGRASTPAGAFMDLLDGETYLGQPINNLVDVAREEGKRVLPFSAAGALEAGAKAGPLGAATGAAASFMGLRSLPRNYEDVLEETSQRHFARPYRDLNLEERGTVRADEAVKGRPIPPSDRYERTRAVTGAYQQYEDAVNKSAQQVAEGTIPLSKFREDEHTAQMARNQRLTDAGAPADRKLAEVEADRRKYHEILQNVDEFGRRDYDTAEAFLQGLPPKSQEYIRKRQIAGYANLSDDGKRLMTELREARELLKPYRNIRREVMERSGMWDDWVAANPAERKELMKSPRYQYAEREWTRRAENYRRSHRDADDALVRWYDLTPIWQRKR